MTMFIGEAGVSTYVAVTLRAGLRLYKNTGMRPNRAWTPTRMLAKTESITGKKFKRGQFDEAIAALDKWIEENGRTQ